MSRMTNVLAALVMVAVSSTAAASRRGDKEPEPPKVYKEKVQQMLNSLVVDEAGNKTSPLTVEEHEEFRQYLRKNDLFRYEPNDGLQITNKTVHVSLKEPGIPVIKLSHTFNTTLIFTDVLGHPWEVDTLTDISNKEVVSVEVKKPNMITVRPKKRAGKTNLPVKLKGEQRPVTFLFDITDDEVYFDVNVEVDGFGDSSASQRALALNNYSQGLRVAPKLNRDPAKQLMLQFMTPDGYEQKRVFDDYREPVDERDFVVWTKGDEMFVLTPHDAYNPDPIDVVAANDGRYKLLVFKKIPLLAMKKDSQIHWLHIE
ncbi:MAG: hypothetical protein CL840_03805 [Crocinitomicaceae bacterium]|nr:hypothetical protein [Crocinitomicaceae bacterium]